MNPEAFSSKKDNEALIEKTRKNIHSVNTLDKELHLPGEGGLKKKENQANGVQVDKFYFEKVKSYIK